MLHLHHCLAGFVDRSPESGSNSRQQRATVGRAFFSSQDLDFVAINVSLDLSPKLRTRSAATQANIGDRHPHFLEERKCVLQTESYAFKHCPSDVRTRMARS